MKATFCDVCYMKKKELKLAEYKSNLVRAEHGLKFALDVCWEHRGYTEASEALEALKSTVSCKREAFQ